MHIASSVKRIEQFDEIVRQRVAADPYTLLQLFEIRSNKFQPDCVSLPTFAFGNIKDNQAGDAIMPGRFGILFSVALFEPEFSVVGKAPAALAKRAGAFYETL